jgi:hypothetical protein
MEAMNQVQVVEAPVATSEIPGVSLREFDLMVDGAQAFLSKHGDGTTSTVEAGLQTLTEPADADAAGIGSATRRICDKWDDAAGNTHHLYEDE